jgi:hypothetical protein
MDLSWIFDSLSQIIIFGVVITSLLIIYLYFKQENMIFPTSINGMKYPEDNPDPYKSPLQLGLKYKEIKTITPDNIKLVGWLVYMEENKKNRTLLYFHENAGSKSQIILYIYKYLYFRSWI